MVYRWYCNVFPIYLNVFKCIYNICKNKLMNFEYIKIEVQLRSSCWSLQSETDNCFAESGECNTK